MHTYIHTCGCPRCSKNRSGRWSAVSATDDSWAFSYMYIYKLSIYVCIYTYIHSYLRMSAMQQESLRTVERRVCDRRLMGVGGPEVGLGCVPLHPVHTILSQHTPQTDTHHMTHTRAHTHTRTRHTHVTHAHVTRQRSVLAVCHCILYTRCRINTHPFGGEHRPFEWGSRAVGLCPPFLWW